MNEQITGTFKFIVEKNQINQNILIGNIKFEDKDLKFQTYFIYKDLKEMIDVLGATYYIFDDWKEELKSIGYEILNFDFVNSFRHLDATQQESLYPVLLKKI